MVPALSRMYLKNQVGSLSDLNFATCNGSYSTAWGRCDGGVGNACVFL